MTVEELIAKKQQLEKQRRQTEQSFHQLTGAIAIIEEQLASDRAKKVKVEDGKPPEEKKT